VREVMNLFRVEDVEREKKRQEKETGQFKKESEMEGGKGKITSLKGKKEKEKTKSKKSEKNKYEALRELNFEVIKHYSGQSVKLQEIVTSPMSAGGGINIGAGGGVGGGGGIISFRPVQVRRPKVHEIYDRSGFQKFPFEKNKSIMGMNLGQIRLPVVVCDKDKNNEEIITSDSSSFNVLPSFASSDISLFDLFTVSSSFPLSFTLLYHTSLTTYINNKNSSSSFFSISSSSSSLSSPFPRLSSPFSSQQFDGLPVGIKVINDLVPFSYFLDIYRSRDITDPLSLNKTREIQLSTWGLILFELYSCGNEHDCVSSFNALFPGAVQPWVDMIEILVRRDEWKREVERLQEREKGKKEKGNKDNSSSNKKDVEKGTHNNVINSVREILHFITHRPTAKLVIDGVCMWYKNCLNESYVDEKMNDLNFKTAEGQQKERVLQKSFFISLQSIAIEVSLEVDPGSVEQFI
jgi:hypothetical protein